MSDDEGGAHDEDSVDPRLLEISRTQTLPCPQSEELEAARKELDDLQNELWEANCRHMQDCCSQVRSEEDQAFHTYIENLMDTLKEKVKEAEKAYNDAKMRAEGAKNGH
jgi:hypothetical protein